MLSGVKEYGVKEYGTKEYGVKEYGVKEYTPGTNEYGVNEYGVNEYGVPHDAGATDGDPDVPGRQFHPDPISPNDVCCAKASEHVCEVNIGPTTVPGSYPAATFPQYVYQTPDGAGVNEYGVNEYGVNEYGGVSEHPALLQLGSVAPDASVPEFVQRFVEYDPR